MCSRIFLLRTFKKPVTTAIKIKSYHSVYNALLLKSSVPATIQVRSFWESFPYIRPFFHQKDGLSKEKYALVYRTKLFNYAFYSQLICCSMLTLEAATGIYYVYKQLFNLGPLNLNTEVGPFVINYNLTTLIITSLFTLQSILVIYASQACVTRVYYCEETDSFVLVKLGLLNPFKSELLPCKSGELVPLEENGLNIVFGNHKLRDKRLFVSMDYFKDMSLYNKLVSKDDHE